MALETVPASSQSDGRWRITYTDLAADPLSVADLDAGTALTYSFTADGFNWAISQATVEDKRLTLDQDLTRPGRKSETLEVQYVASEDAGSAAVVLAEGTEGHLTVRRGIANSVVNTVAQVADVITFVAGAQRPDAPAENGRDTISQTLYITAPTVQGGVLVA